jgi:hypothetical protein
MAAFKHSAVRFGMPDMSPPDVGSSIGSISLHNAIGCESRSSAGLGGGFMQDFECDLPRTRLPKLFGKS